MKKTSVILIIGFLFSISTLADSINIDGKRYRMDTLANFKVGPGSHYTAIRLTGPRPLNVFFLKVDATNPYITYKAALGQDSIYSGEKPSAVAKRKSKEGAVYFAGTNGDFYNTSGYVGMPIGTTMIEKEIANNQTKSDWHQFAFDTQKTPYIGSASFSGNLTFKTFNYSIHHVNHLRETDQLVLYNQYNGKYTHTNSYGTEVLIELPQEEKWGVNKTIKAKVVKIEKNKGNMLIPKGSAILSGHGEAANVLSNLTMNDIVDIHLNISIDDVVGTYENMIGADPRNVMLTDGVVSTTGIWNARHPRTAFGYSQDKKTIIHCVVDGRSSVSYGVNTKELAELMLSAGAYNAVNIDGGGSSCLYIKKFGTMNQNSDGRERSVANAIFVVSTAPTDNQIEKIRNIKQKIKIPQYGMYNPTFFGYNQYGVLISTDVENVHLSTTSNTGEILNDSLFFASGAENGFITATYNGITTKIEVEKIKNPEIKIRLDSVLLDNTIEYPIEVKAIAEDDEMNIFCGALSWLIKDASVCNVRDGVLKGIKNGNTLVIGSLGNFKDTIKVNVEIPETTIRLAQSFNPEDNWSITSSSNLTDKLHHPTSEGVKSSFSFGAGRYTYMAYAKDFPLYSLPDTFKIVFNPGEIDVSKVIFEFQKSNSGIQSINKDFSGFTKNRNNTIAIPLNKLMDNPNDRGSYPLIFKSMQFVLNGASMTADNKYGLDIKRFVLLYDNTSSAIDEEELKETKCHVFPNPIKNGKLNIAFNLNEKRDIEIALTSLGGKVIKKITQTVIPNEILLFSVKDVHKGTYILHVKDVLSSFNFSNKIIIP